MKNAILSLLLLAALPAFGADTVIECSGRGDPSDNFVGGVSIHGNSFTRAAHAADNYISGRAVCEEVGNNAIRCTGLWRHRVERLDIIVRNVGTPRVNAVLNRPTFYGGQTVELPCTERPAQQP
jgi:hypothetical protein